MGASETSKCKTASLLLCSWVATLSSPVLKVDPLVSHKPQGPHPQEVRISHNNQYGWGPGWGPITTPQPPPPALCPEGETETRGCAEIPKAAQLA